MKILIQILLSAIIFFPLFIFLTTYYICKRRSVSTVRSVGIASDQTTLWLFFSVPLAIGGLWEMDVGMIVVIVAIIIAMLFTFIEWKTKKEIEVKSLFRKVWRLYFLILFTTYVLIWIIGIIHNIMQYVTVS